MCTIAVTPVSRPSGHLAKANLHPLSVSAELPLSYNAVARHDSAERWTRRRLHTRAHETPATSRRQTRQSVLAGWDGIHGLNAT